MRDIKAAYDQGVNVMKLFRDIESNANNSLNAIEISYDMQAGSYIAALSNPKRKEHKTNYSRAIASILDKLGCDSVLEAGVGEATTLANVAKQMESMPREMYGFDISWSRIACAKQFIRCYGLAANLFVANLLDIPIVEGGIDIVYTSGSIEPNREKTKEILLELYRVARSYLVLLEPSNELGSERTKKHIEAQKYCKDLYKTAKELGLRVVEHRLFDYSDSFNEKALMIIEKPIENEHTTINQSKYACPHCKNSLLAHKGHLFCEQDFLIFPIIDGIPCLRKEHGILGSKYNHQISLP